MGPFYARNVNSAVLQIYLSGWKRKNVVKLVPHQQIFVWVHYVVATVASSNLVWWEMPFATHLRLHLKLQRAETENRGTGTGDEVREWCGLQHYKMGGRNRLFIDLFFSSGQTVEKPTWYWTERRSSATTAALSCTAPTSRAAPTPWPTSTAAAKASHLATGKALCTKVGPPAWKSSFPSSATRTATPNSGETEVRDWRHSLISPGTRCRWLMDRTREPVDLRTHWT